MNFIQFFHIKTTNYNMLSYGFMLKTKNYTIVRWKENDTFLFEIV